MKYYIVHSLCNMFQQSYKIISISYSCHVCSARNMGTIKGEKLNEPESDPSPICKKKKNGPSLARMDSACRAPSGPDGLADLYHWVLEQSHCVKGCHTSVSLQRDPVTPKKLIHYLWKVTRATLSH